MTEPQIGDPAGLLGEAPVEARSDLMRSLLHTRVNALAADREAVVGAERGTPSPARTVQRNGFSPANSTPGSARSMSRSPSCAPIAQWLLRRRKLAETAFNTVVADCYLTEVSTR